VLLCGGTIGEIPVGAFLDSAMVLALILGGAPVGGAKIAVGGGKFLPGWIAFPAGFCVSCVLFILLL